MLTIERTVRVTAPPERILGLVGDVTNLPGLCPSALQVTDVRPLPTGGHHCHFSYALGGRVVEGDADTIELVGNRKLVDRLTGGVDGVLEWAVRPHNGTTEIGLRLAYVPAREVLARIGEPELRTRNEHEAESVLASLKALLER